MNAISSEIRTRLFELADDNYRSFHTKLIPTVHPERIIGVRTPELRKFARELFKNPDIQQFLNDLPHKYYDENNLHGFIIEQLRDFEKCAAEIELFLPYIDNWATCDMISPKVFGKNPDKLIEKIRLWTASDHVYTVRFGIVMLMRYFLGDNFSNEYPELVLSLPKDDYYISMAAAWYFATALTLRYDDVLPYIENYRLDAETHNRTIRKARESFRVPREHKEHLRKFRIK